MGGWRLAERHNGYCGFVLANAVVVALACYKRKEAAIDGSVSARWLVSGPRSLNPP